MSIGSTNITTSLVSSTIGLASNDVGTLCKATNVNKWSKYKPVSYATNAGITLTNIQATNFGFHIQYTADNSDGSLGTTWTYVKPTGGASSPYRLGDFRLYNHSSVQPFSTQIPNSVATSGGGENVKLIINSVASDNVAFNDLFPTSSNYFGVCIVRGTQLFYKTASTTIANGGTTIMINDSSLTTTAGSVTVYLFVTGSIISSWNNDVTQAMYPLNCDANVAVKTVTVAQSMPNTYSFAFGGINTVDKNKISRTGTVNHITTINQTCKIVNSQLTYSYALNNITLKITQYSNSAVVYNTTFATDSNSYPMNLDPSDNILNSTFTAMSSMYYNMSLLPALQIGDYYSAVYTLNYIQQ